MQEGAQVLAGGGEAHLDGDLEGAGYASTGRVLPRR
jgi:hypothetical protein